MTPSFNGTLALLGAGEYLPAVEAIDRFLLSRLPAPQQVVCLPTAAGDEGPERLAYWNDLGVAHFTRLGAEVAALPVIDRASAQDTRLADRVAEANFVYLSGGKPTYLLETLADTPVFEAIMHVLDTGGVVAGCSAGAMIWGERIPRFPPPPIWKSGLAFLPNIVVIPHFDEMSYLMTNILHFVLGNGYTLVGIDCNTALVCMDGFMTVTGSGGVTVWDEQRKDRYTNGALVNLPIQ